MKGLIIKDLRLITSRSRIIILLFAVCFFMCWQGNPSFGIGYTTFVFAFLALSSIAYDDTEGGFAFLMTLPVRRSTYVLEKYLLATAFALGAIIAGSLFSWIAFFFNEVEFTLLMNLEYAVIFFAVAVIVTSLNVPIQLKWGSEQSRVIVMIILVAVVGAVYAVSKVSPALMGEALLLVQTHGVLIAGLLAVVMVAAVAGSICISIHIFENKEF